jgi:hypothetical protein
MTVLTRGALAEGSDEFGPAPGGRSSRVLALPQCP